MAVVALEERPLLIVIIVPGRLEALAGKESLRDIPAGTPPLLFCCWPRSISKFVCWGVEKPTGSFTDELIVRAAAAFLLRVPI